MGVQKSNYAGASLAPLTMAGVALAGAATGVTLAAAVLRLLEWAFPPQALVAVLSL